MKRSQSCCL